MEWHLKNYGCKELKRVAPVKTRKKKSKQEGEAGKLRAKRKKTLKSP